MNNNSLKMLGLMASVALFGSLTVKAQDKATLDLLVKKGIITQADADGVAKSSAAIPVVPHDSNVKKMQLEGDLQIQYDWLTSEDKTSGAANPPATSEFMIRRAHLGAIADLGNGWSGEILMDFAAGAQAPSAPQAGIGDAWNLFEKAIITDNLSDYDGKLTIGYTKVMFGLEETTSANAVKPIERSLGSRYFDEAYRGQTSRRLGFANHHVGLFWDGTVSSIPGFVYGGALTNGVQTSEQYTNPGGFNKFAVWLYSGYGSKFGDLSYKGGINFGISPSGNSNPGPGATAQSNTVWGYNPYLTLDYGNFELSSEFEQAVADNARTNAGAVTSRAAPYAITITPSYKITPQWEVVARYSYLNSNGRGIAPGDVVRDGVNPSVGGTLFDSADQYYVGVNWYIMGNSLKWSLGYEYSEFSNRGTNASNLTGPKFDIEGIRTRMQITF